MDQYVVEGAHDRWSRVSQNRHLDPIVGDTTIGFTHASPQIIVVGYGCTIGKRARLFSRITFGFMFSVSYVVNVTEGAAVVDWKPVLAVLRSGDGYSEWQKMKNKERKRHVQELDGQK